MKSTVCMSVILLYIGYRYTVNAEDGSTTISTSTTSATGESDLAFFEKMDEKMESLSVKVAEHMNSSRGLMIEELHKTKADITEQLTEEHQLVVNAISNVCNRSCGEGSLGGEQLGNTTVEKVDVTLLNREDGSVNFTKNWAEYKAGFGNLQGEYWLGLELLHLITTAKDYGLRVDFGDFEGNVYQSRYSSIAVGPESGEYKLTLSGYDNSSTGGDSLTNSVYGPLNLVNNMKFSTIGRDNDENPHFECAENIGGWWWNGCGVASPTGQYLTGGQMTTTGIYWQSGKDNDYSYKYMKLTLVHN